MTRPHRLAGLALWIAIAGGTLGATTVTSAALAAQRPQPAVHPFEATTRPLSPVVDGRIVVSPRDIEDAYVDCLRGVAGSADAKERWAATCRARAPLDAEARVIEEACLRSVGGSADATERWVDACRARAGR